MNEEDTYMGGDPLPCAECGRITEDATLVDGKAFCAECGPVEPLYDIEEEDSYWSEFYAHE